MTDEKATTDEQEQMNPEDYLPDTKGKAFSIFVWRHKAAWLLAILVLFIGADHLSKEWAQANLTHTRQVTELVIENGVEKEVQITKFYAKKPMVVIPQMMNFRYAENPAAAFSFTQSVPKKYRMPFLIGISGIVMIFILLWYFRMRKPDGIMMTAFAMILSGAIGNFIDRVRLGYVIDFIDNYAGFLNNNWPHWPTWNIADSCIVLGMFLFLFRIFKPLYPED